MTAPEAAELEAVDAALAGRDVAPEHEELAELALLLRDERPAPAPAWTARLDRRVADRFPAPPRRARRWVWRAAPAFAVVLLIAPIALIAALSPRDAGDEGAGGAAMEATDSAGGGSVASPGSPGAGDPDSDGRADRAVERSAMLTLAAPGPEIDGVAGRIGAVAAELGGFVASSSISSENGGSIELRVPSERLDDAVERVSRLGNVRNLSRGTLDITATVVSARERLTDARAERKSLLRQLADADTLNETESLRARLRIVSREIAAARGALERARNRANFANLSVFLEAEDGAGAWTPGDAADDALRALEVAAGVAVVAAAVLVPLVPVLLLAWLARRAFVRRRRERALDPA